MERIKKFDIVIGNPPYQTKREEHFRKTQTIWPDFVKLAIDSCALGGYVAFIHPSLWRKPENKLFELFKNRDLIYVEMHDIKYGVKTFGASTAYDWYILNNSIYNGKTEIKDTDGVYSFIDIRGFNCLPSSDIELFNNIIARERDEKCEVIFDCSYHTQRDYMSDNQTEVFKYPCLYMNTKEKGMQFWYSSKKDNGHFGINKVIITITGGFLGTYNDYNGEYGLTQYMFGIKIDSKEEGDNIIKAIKSDKFKKIWKATQWMSNHRERRAFKLFRKDFWKEFI